MNRVHEEWFSCDFSQISLFILKWLTLLRIVVMVHYGTPRDARHGIADYFTLYTTERPHQALDYRRPADRYLG